MPRSVPHFKAHASLKNHRKMAVVYGDNDLFALWTRLGIEAITRFADRTGDSFIVHDRELNGLTGKGRADVARRLLSRLADVSPISAERDGEVWRITFPNLATKQGFGPRNGARKGAPSTSTPTPTSSIGSKSQPAAADSVSTFSLKGSAPAPKGSKKRALENARAVWPQLVELAASHSKTWSPEPGKNQLEVIASRIHEGASRDDCLDAVRGYADLHLSGEQSGDVDMGKFFRVSTIFRASRMPEYIEAARDAGQPDAREAVRQAERDEMRKQMENP